MKKQLNAVKDFHDTFGLNYNDSPTVDLGKKIIELRFNLMKEENEEYIEAARNNDIIEIKIKSQSFLKQQIRSIVGCLKYVGEKKWTLKDLSLTTGGPARYSEISETGQKVGFITPLTHNFCESCNRVRMTCTGQLFMCLGQEEDADLKSALRERSDNDQLLRKRIMQAVDRKPKGHDFDYSRKKISGQMSRFMSHTGG